ncbi:MAG: DUF3325 domain-containing protein [Pseudomonadota bacterium]
MSWGIAFLLAIPGFAGLSLSMFKHQRSVFGGALPAARSKLYRWLGYSLITASVLWTMFAYGWSLGLVVSCGVATLSSVLVILGLTLRPKAVRYLLYLPMPRADDRST